MVPINGPDEKKSGLPKVHFILQKSAGYSIVKHEFYYNTQITDSPLIAHNTDFRIHPTNTPPVTSKSTQCLDFKCLSQIDVIFCVLFLYF